MTLLTRLIELLLVPAPEPPVVGTPPPAPAELPASMRVPDVLVPFDTELDNLKNRFWWEQQQNRNLTWPVFISDLEHKQKALERDHDHEQRLWRGFLRETDGS